MLPALGSLTSNITLNYDNNGDMHVLGAGARGVDENQRKQERETNRERNT